MSLVERSVECRWTKFCHIVQQNLEGLGPPKIDNLFYKHPEFENLTQPFCDRIMTYADKEVFFGNVIKALLKNNSV